MIIEEKADKKSVIVAVAALVIGLVIGIVVTMAFYKSKISNLQGKNAALSGPGKLGAPLDLPKVKVPDTVNSISGKVDKIDGNTLFVTAYFFGEEKKYTVNVGSGTKIVKRELKADVKPLKEGEAPESPFKETDASFSDIKAGTMISADAAENIKNKTSFEAKTVYIEVTNLPEVPKTPEMPELPKLPDMPKTPSVPDTPKLPDMPKVPKI